MNAAAVSPKRFFRDPQSEPRVTQIVVEPVTLTERKPYPLFEWCAGSMMVLMALTMMVSPSTIRIGAFRYLLQVFSPTALTIGYAFAGLLRLLALLSDKRWRWGPHARGFAAGLSALIWGQMCLALILLTQETGTLSIGIPVYLVLTAGEIISCYRICRYSPSITLFYSTD